MSSWATYETEIKARLTTNGYSEQPDNYDVDDPDASNAKLHKGYSIKVIGIEKTTITGSAAYHTYKVELKISYLNTLTNTRPTNFGLFDDLLSELVTSGTYFPNFVTLSDDPTFLDDDISSQNSIGTITMWYGLRGC